MNSSLQVTSPATDITLLSLAQLRDACGVSDGSRDAALTDLGNRVAATVARICKVAPGGAVPITLRSETITETFRLKNTRSRLPLSRTPVTAISSVAEDGAALTSAQYEVDESSGLLARLCADDPSTWSAGKHVVVYTAGWEVVPGDLQLAATKLAGVLWAEATREPGLKREDIPGVIEREYWVPPASDPLAPAEVMELLAPYINDWI